MQDSFNSSLHHEGITTELLNTSEPFETTELFQNLSSAEPTNVTDLDNYYTYRNEEIATLWCLLVTIILGNLSVLIALVITKRRRSRVNFFIQHLALTDLSVGLISVTTDLVWKITAQWTAGNIACKLVRYSQGIVTYSATYVLVALTIDRYDAIINPMNFSRGLRKSRYLIISAWGMSCLLSSPLVVFYKTEIIQEIPQCWLDFPEQWHWQVYMTFISLTVFFIPAIVIAFCYAVIVYTIWTKSNIMLMSKSTCNNNWSGDEDNTKRVSSRGIIPKAKVKTIKMTLVIVFVFIACWSPYMIHNLLQVFGAYERSQTTIAISTFIQSLAHLNSAVNPIIYWCFSTYHCKQIRNKRQWMDSSRVGRSVRITDSTNFSESFSESRRNIHLHSITPAQRKLILQAASQKCTIKTLKFSTNNPNRRMFPTLKFRFHGLSFSSSYIVFMDVVPADGFKYRYTCSKWVVASPSKSSCPDEIFIHPNSPATGEVWNSESYISFRTVKLTNNAERRIQGQIALQSMHKYQPRIKIVEVPANINIPQNQLVEYVKNNSQRTSTFVFPQTSFFAVTVYWNQEITNLKILCNPLAKGMIERSKRHSSVSQHDQPCPPCFVPYKVPVKLIIPPPGIIDY